MDACLEMFALKVENVKSLKMATRDEARKWGSQMVSLKKGKARPTNDSAGRQMLTNGTGRAGL